MLLLASSLDGPLQKLPSSVTMISRAGLLDYNISLFQMPGFLPLVKITNITLKTDMLHQLFQLLVSSSSGLPRRADKTINTADTQRSSAAISQEPKHLTRPPLLLYFTCDSPSWLRNRPQSQACAHPPCTLNPSSLPLISHFRFESLFLPGTCIIMEYLKYTNTHIQNIRNSYKRIIPFCFNIKLHI